MWIWRGSHSTPRRTDRCVRSTRTPLTCREPWASAELRPELFHCRQRRTQGGWCFILEERGETGSNWALLKTTCRPFFCIAQTRSQMKILNQANIWTNTSDVQDRILRTQKVERSNISKMIHVYGVTKTGKNLRAVMENPKHSVEFLRAILANRMQCQTVRTAGYF